MLIGYAYRPKGSTGGSFIGDMIAQLIRFATPSPGNTADTIGEIWSRSLVVERVYQTYIFRQFPASCKNYLFSTQGDIARYENVALSIFSFWLRSQVQAGALELLAKRLPDTSAKSCPGGTFVTSILTSIKLLATKQKDDVPVVVLAFSMLSTI